ncbi:MAG: cation:proton antiporter, partial [Bacteroidota bacterium]
MEQLGSDIYLTIIGITVIVILSFLYNAFSEKTNIPAVLLLIATGIGLNFGLDAMSIEQLNWQPILELTGIVGLIMIVLEAALDLELKAENLPMIIKSFTVALIGLVASTAACAYILYLAVDGMEPITAFLYATPLS